MAAAIDIAFDGYRTFPLGTVEDTAVTPFSIGI
jgi:hypothetical protein